MPRRKATQTTSVSQQNILAQASLPQLPSTNPSTTVPLKHLLYFIETSTKGISVQHTKIIEKQLKNITGDILFLVIHTYGGDVYSAVRIMKILQSKFPVIKVIIPDFAFSSGTIMALGADEILMNIDSTLGPLDLLMEHPGDGSTISSLDVTDTLTNIASICASIGMRIYGELRKDKEDSRLGKNFASKLAFETAAQIVNPILNKIDPFNLQKGFREAKIGFYYAIDLLRSRMMKDNSIQALETSSALVNNYPSHGFRIFRDEARDTLKLKVSNLEAFQEWQKISSRFETLKNDYTKFIKYEII